MSFQKILNDWLSTPIFEGGRNGELFKAAAACKDLGYSKSEAQNALISKAQSDGLKYGEINQTIDSAFNRPVSEMPRLESNTIGQTIEWDDDLSGLLHAPKRKIDIYKAQIPPPSSHWREDFKRLIESAFEPGEIINIVKEVFENEKGKFIPRGKGDQITYENFIKLDPNKFQEWVGHNNGAYMRINPTDGQGVADKNIKNFRHVLVESDTLGLEEQLAIYRELQLPVSALIHSGGKSIHAWVRVEAENMDQYKKRCAYVYEVLEAQGFEIDLGNKNPSRLSRLVGVDRGENQQYLISERSGHQDWASWVDFWETKANGLPEIEKFTELQLENPQLEPILIDGVLRQGHKLLIGGPSKAGKSFWLINLALSLSTGKPFFGFPVEKSSVLYVNFEISRPSFYNRVSEVSKKLGVNEFDNLDVWNLRGKSTGIEELAPQIIRKIKDRNYGAVILDPTYKFMGDRDENNAGDITSLMNYLDQISVQTGCSIVLAAHFSKGKQGDKNQTDRISGSGVFGRDPDAIITLSEVKDEPNGYMMEGTLREFAAFDPIPIRFNYPTHEIDMSMADKKVDGDTSSNDVDPEDIFNVFMTNVGGDIEATLKAKDLAKSCNMSIAKLKSYVSEMGAVNGLQLVTRGNFIAVN